MSAIKHPGLILIAALLLAAIPAFAGASAIDRITVLLIYMLLALTWNLMAGYAGLVSVGQQAFFGLSGYVALRVVDGGLSAYPALLVGAMGSALVAWVASFYLLRLKNGEFAIATWVFAEVIRILVMLDPMIQGETGTSLIALNAVDPEMRRSIGYWIALASLAGMALATTLLLRSHVGLAARAIGDDDEAAASLGVRVLPTRQVIFVLCAFGAALAGVAWLASAITFLPRTNFGVQWSVLMLFMVLVGGLRSGAGPYIGALILFALEQWVGHLGAWYLGGLGAAAAACALFLPHGLWGAAQVTLRQIVARRATTSTSSAPVSSPPSPIERTVS